MDRDILGSKKIAILGNGHMGQAIARGFMTGGLKRSQILISDKSNNVELTKKTDYIFITVKPFIVKDVLKEIKPFILKKIVLSVAAGVTMRIMEKVLGRKQKIIRLMPNILVSENKGVIGFFANKNISSSEKNEVVDLISILGKVIICKEEDLDYLTVLAGCGPAISAYFIDLLSNFAVRQGFSHIESINMALKIFEGTIDHLKSNDLTASELIKSVATKGGVTEAIIRSLYSDKVDSLFNKAMEKGNFKIIDLKNKLK